MFLTDNKEGRIAQNTLFLYLRMFIILVVGLYTSRIVLKALGIVDYGINNVVAGVVTMFSVVGGALSGAISRFITFELGKGNNQKLQKVFSISMTIQFVMSIVALLLMETFGLWFLNAKLNIPSERLCSANWVFQSAIFCFVLNLLCVPYNAVIIAHEKMNVFAIISMIETFLKFLVALSLIVTSYDGLKLYALLLLVVAIFIRLISGMYCSKHFQECHYSFVYDKDLIKQIGVYSGWTFFSGLGNMLCTQGLNILINIYFGVVVNTARGIVVQVEGVVKTFINNFTTALSPQIVKSYAQGNKEYMQKLAYCGSKFTSYLMILIAVPLLIETPMVIELWLGSIPKYSVVFFRWTLVTSFFDTALVISFRDCINATGNIKKYQLVTTICLWLIFPLTWIAYALGTSPVYGYVINFIVVFVLMFFRLSIVMKTLKFSMNSFLKNVFLRVVVVFTISLFFSITLTYLCGEGLFRMFILLILNSVVVLASIFLFGLSNTEKEYIVKMLKKRNLMR